MMSEEIGMSVNTINRHLLTFRKEGLISMLHGKVAQNAVQRASAKNALQIYIAQNRLLFTPHVDMKKPTA